MGIPLDYSEIYLGTHFEYVYHGTYSLDSPVPVKKIDDDIYSWDWDTLESALCTGAYYILEQKIEKVWFFYYDDMSGISETLGGWGQKHDFGPTRHTFGSMISIEIKDCQLYVFGYLVGRPASFKDGQITGATGVHPFPFDLYGRL